LKYNQDGDIQIHIEDDGIGIDQRQSQSHHYGLTIMNERSKSIHGHLSIETRSSGGTLVKLVFSPSNPIKPVNFNHE